MIPDDDDLKPQDPGPVTSSTWVALVVSVAVVLATPLVAIVAFFGLMAAVCGA